jgi:plastocyanin domain-containing protein
MKRVMLLSLGLMALVGTGTWAQDARVVQYARQLSRLFVQDGLTIETGMAADGTQNLAVLANNGYFPLQVTAKAGVPSTLRVYTDRTYDCSRAFYLPDLNQKAGLPAKGVKVFSIPAQKRGTTLFGTCGMGMYTFEIRFE